VPRPPLALALVLGLLLSGPVACGDDAGCHGNAYDPDLSAPGAETPIEALVAWLGTDTAFEELPADDGWIVQDGGEDPERVIIEHDDGDGWWVSTVRTDDGGWAVDMATDDRETCGDRLAD